MKRRTAAAFAMLASVALAFLAGLSLPKAAVLLQWKLTLLATEFGHWFAAAALIVLAACLKTVRERGVRWPAAALLVFAAAIFARPAVMALAMQEKVRGALTSAFGPGAAPTGPVVRFARLWAPSHGPDIVPRTITHGDSLIMKFYPTNIRPAPWVVVVHGGGWNGGDPSQLEALNRELAAEGIAVAAVSYRFAPASKWPAQREDVLTAVRHLRANSAALGLDPSRWALLGRSAGGQIAEAVAYKNPPPGLRGCVAFYAPADLNFAFTYAADNDVINSKQLMKDLLGGTPKDAKAMYDDASPYRAVDENAPPTLLLHGANDALTWRRQSQRLQGKLSGAGVPAALILLPWATHGFDYSLNGPGGQISTYAVKGFLKSVFAGTR